TYTGGRRESVIDYVLVDEEAREQIESMEIGDAIESDHHPLIVTWTGGKEKGKNKLIWAMVSYGVEIWGWKEREVVESLQERYLRWVLGVERRTPGYLVREELQREKLRAKAGKRAWAFEERIRKGGREEREQYFVERGVEVDRGLMGGGEGEINFEEIQERDREMQRVETWEKIGSRDIISGMDG
ncbi:hypothetical protein ALC57_16779, partial [Trachymyrmex cornetzi]